MNQGPKEEELEEWLGADICEEMCGPPNAPNTLLWLANSFCWGVTQVPTLISELFHCDFDKKSNKIN